MKSKKGIVILVGIFLFLCLALAATSGGNKPKTDTASSQAQAVTVKEPTPTKEPTAAPTPKPTNTPIPTATPVKGLTAAEEAYRMKVVSQTDALAKSFSRFAVLCNNPKFFDSGWKIDVAMELALWKVSYTEAKKWTPSARFQKFHDKYISALAQYDSAANDAADGIDDIDSSLIQRAINKTNEGSRLLKEATELLKGIVI